MNKFVYNISDVDKIAFGAIVDQETRDSWLWYKVEWPTVRPSNIYNNSNYNTLFDSNVRVEYITHIILSEKLDLNFNKNMVKIYDNVTYEGLDGIIETDVINMNLTTKNIEIFMKNSNEKVQIMSK